MIVHQTDMLCISRHTIKVMRITKYFAIIHCHNYQQQLNGTAMNLKSGSSLGTVNSNIYASYCQFVSTILRSNLVSMAFPTRCNTSNCLQEAKPVQIIPYVVSASTRGHKQLLIINDCKQAYLHL